MKRILIIGALILYIFYEKGSHNEDLQTLSSKIHTDSLQIQHCRNHHPRWNSFNYVK